MWCAIWRRGRARRTIGFRPASPNSKRDSPAVSRPSLVPPRSQHPIRHRTRSSFACGGIILCRDVPLEATRVVRHDLPATDETDSSWAGQVMAEIYSLHGERLSPLDRVERLANARDWFVDRAGDDEVNMIVGAQWGDLTVSLNWRDDVESLHIACSFDVRVPGGRREEIGRLVTMLNEQLYFGHFDLWRHDGT